jgi:nucleoside-diphosphate-sugar epimerase
MITDAKILVSGVTGMVGAHIARHLAPDNEVWGISRFASPGPARAELDAAGITTRAIDLGSGEFDDLPDDFTYVLHLAWARAGIDQLEDALRTNVEGAGLLLQHCQQAEAALVMSGMGIYTGHPDPWHAYTETDPIGRGSTAYAATSPASKLGVESVARFCARAFDLPTVITRLNTVMGPPGSFPGMHITALFDGQPMPAPCDPNPHATIHLDDMTWQLEALLDAAATPALITNWCGDEVTTAQQWMARAAERSGRTGEVVVREVPGSPAGTLADPARRLSITGPCRTDFWAEFDALYDTMTGSLDEPQGR